MKRFPSRRRVLLGGAVAAAAASTRVFAQGAKWPERAITLIHGFGVGGNADVIARLVAEQLSVRLGQPVVVEAKPGAGGRIAAANVAKAAPDGYTLAVLPGGHAIAAAMFDGLPYDTAEDFTFVSMLTDFPFLLVTYPDHPVRSVKDLVAAAKAAAQPMIYGTAGNGTGQHLSGALFARMADITLQHLPFRGGALGSQELLGKHIDMLFETPTLLLELVRSGQVRALGVTGKERFFGLPDVPTIAETVPGYETSSWLGLAGPPKLPADISARLHTEVSGLLQDPKLLERFKTLGNLPAPTTPDAFKARVKADIAKWTRVVTESGIPRVRIQ
jgi:tripartite-type tricarboxylate transporter receptor subunit TctC